MPVVIQKPPPPLKPVDLSLHRSPAQAPQQPGLTMSDVVALLDARDKAFARQIDALSRAIAAAVQSLQPKPSAEPRKGATIKVHRDARGHITSADIVPNGEPVAKAAKKGLE